MGFSFLDFGEANTIGFFGEGGHWLDRKQNTDEQQSERSEEILRCKNQIF